MSTQKNEHNPDNLAPEQIGEGWRLLQYGEVIEPTDEMWHISYGKGRWVPTGSQAPGRPIEKCNLAHRRRITPPTDTTGSGREGETPTHNEKLTPPMALCDILQSETQPIDGHGDPGAVSDSWRSLREQIEFMESQVEALRRDGERLASQCSDMRASLNEIANNSNYKSGGKFFYLSRLLEFAAQASAAVVADASFEDTARLEFVIQFIQKHGLKGLGDAIVEIYKASDVREFGREAIDNLRAAIDSAQRQEGR